MIYSTQIAPERPALQLLHVGGGGIVRMALLIQISEVEAATKNTNPDVLTRRLGILLKNSLGPTHPPF